MEIIQPRVETVSQFSGGDFYCVFWSFKKSKEIINGVLSFWG
jgi:hypothetical protein